jgi:hypothetical protein
VGNAPRQAKEMLCVASRQQQAKQKLEKQLAAVVNRVLARRDPNPLLAIGLRVAPC